MMFKDTIDVIADGETLTAEDWEEINATLEDVYGWDEDHGDEEERIWHYVLFIIRDNLANLNLNQLLEVKRYEEKAMGIRD